MGQLDKTTAQIQAVLDQQLDGEEAVTVGWDDLTNSLIGRRLASNAGTVDYDWEENSIVFSQSGDITNVNDCVSFNIQKPHGASDTEPLRLHFHWEQDTATTREFTVWYRMQDNNAQKTTAWTEIIVDTNTNNVFNPYVSGTLNQITEIAYIPWQNVGLSATLQFRMTRSDSNGGTASVTFVDGHVATDQERGSIGEFEKVPVV